MNWGMAHRALTLTFDKSYGLGQLIVEENRYLCKIVNCLGYETPDYSERRPY